MPTIQQNIARLNQQLASLPPATVIAVAKTFPATAIAEAAAAGIRHIGENYLQESEQKIPACKELSLVWHFIGAVQSNKVAKIAALFDWVHSVDRLSVAQRLSAARDNKPPLNIFMQINIDNEPSKSGVMAENAATTAAAIAALPNLRLRGLMALPMITDNPAQSTQTFRRVADLQKTLIASGIPMDCLSLGMSNDFPLAIAEGATHVRIGTAIFGTRQAKKQ